MGLQLIASFNSDEISLALIVAQAAVVLGVCMIILNLSKDLYEIRERDFDSGSEGRLVLAPVLASPGAARLRIFIRLFVQCLSVFYVFVFALILLLNISDVSKAGLIIPIWKVRIVFSMSDVYVLVTTGHLLFLVITTLIVSFMVRIRGEAAGQRLRASHAEHAAVHAHDQVVITTQERRCPQDDLTGTALVAAMQASPHREIDIEPAGSPAPVRDIDL